MLDSGDLRGNFDNPVYNKRRARQSENSKTTQMTKTTTKDSTYQEPLTKRTSPCQSNFPTARLTSGIYKRNQISHTIPITPQFIKVILRELN